MLPFAGNVERDEIRQTWLAAWHKVRDRHPLSPLEAMLADVLAVHPEYHALLEDPAALAGEWRPAGIQANPFLHLGLHLALREAIAADRPPGLREISGRLHGFLGDAHAAEHRLMDCLAETIWEAARAGIPPDESAFLERACRVLSSSAGKDR